MVCKSWYSREKILRIFIAKGPPLYRKSVKKIFSSISWFTQMGLILMKKVNIVNSAYFSHTHFILTPCYLRGLVQNSPNFVRLLILIWAFRKTTSEAETKKSIFFFRRVSQTVSLNNLNFLNLFLSKTFTLKQVREIDKNRSLH